MANRDCTGNPRPLKTPNQRRITVGKFFYDYLLFPNLTP